jgi:hypothetical protein
MAAAVRAARRQSILSSELTQAPPPLERTLAKFVDVLGAINEERRQELRSLREAHASLLLESRQERQLLRALEERVAGLTWVLIAALAVLLILAYVALTSTTAPVLVAARGAATVASHVYNSNNGVNATQAAIESLYN